MLITLRACSSQTSHVVVLICSINDSCHVKFDYEMGLVRFEAS